MSYSIWPSDGSMYQDGTYTVIGIDVKIVCSNVMLVLLLLGLVGVLVVLVIVLDTKSSFSSRCGVVEVVGVDVVVVVLSW